jgi:hypothetical protein
MSIRSPGLPPGAAPIIGREDALEQLEEALADMESRDQACISWKASRASARPACLPI